MSKDERIQAEMSRLMLIYQDLPANTLEVMRPLIQNAAFMKITMDDLQEEIKEHGAVEDYQNGENQRGRKQAAAMQAYNQIIRNYNNTIKVISTKMPVTSVRYVPIPKQEPVDDRTEEERQADFERVRREARMLLENGRIDSE